MVDIKDTRGKNNEIRFGCATEVKSVALKLNAFFPDIKRSAFYRNIFITGMKKIQEQLEYERKKEKGK